MSPMYNPDDWSQQFDMTLKYEPMSNSTVNTILTKYKDHECLEYIKQLWNLIDYQRKYISEQTKAIVAMKHKVAWKRYDKDESIFTDHLNKPKRTDNMGC